MDGLDEFDRGPMRLEPKQRASFAILILAALNVVSGFTLFLGVLNLVGDGSVLSVVKASLLAIGGTLVAYGVNWLAIERAARLAVRGHVILAPGSILSIASVGIALWMATYAGLVIKQIDSLRQEEHGVKLSQSVATRSKAAAHGLPPFGGPGLTLVHRRSCDDGRSKRESCISRRRDSGRGTVTLALESKLQRATTILQQIERGEAARKEAVARLNGLLDRYRADAASSDLGPIEKRKALQSLDLKIRQAANDLDEAAPIGLLAAYASELEAGVNIPDRPEAEQQINAILRGHAATLKSVLGTIFADEVRFPDFPQQTGVTETLSYIGHFAPIAAVTAVVELVFPLFFWLCTVLTLSWAAYRVSPPKPARPNAEDEAVRRLLSMPVAQEHKGIVDPNRYFPSLLPTHRGGQSLAGE